MTWALGIGVFALFGVTLSLFMRLDARHFPKTALPDLDRWVPSESDEQGERLVATGHPLTRETRVLLRRGGLFQRHALVRQVRYRLPDGTIDSVEPDRVLRRFYW